MSLHFAVLSDPHVTLPQTLWDHPSRFHLGEYSIPALEEVLRHLEVIAPEFLLIPGDLTQHGEPENHLWLQKRLARLPFPAYVIPGNHDVPVPVATAEAIAPEDFPKYYRQFGYAQSDHLYYSLEIQPGIHLIGLNSNQFGADGKVWGWIDQLQLTWLEEQLTRLQGKLVLVMVHHNVLPHLPGQRDSSIGKRYLLENSAELLAILHSHGVQLIFTGHLHIQDIAYDRADGHCLYEITTGSLVSYPHPYRLLKLEQDSLHIKSYRVDAVPGQPYLGEFSRCWMDRRSLPFVQKFLTDPPLQMAPETAQALLPQLKTFWSQVAAGDTQLYLPDFPAPARTYLESFSADLASSPTGSVDNHTRLQLQPSHWQTYLKTKKPQIAIARAGDYWN